MAISVKLKTQPKSTLVDNLPENNNLAFYRSFRPTKSDDNDYFVLNEDFDSVKGRSTAYSLIYFPIIDGFVKLNAENLTDIPNSSIEIKATFGEDKSSKLIPLLINFDREVVHWCDDTHQAAGDKSCADNLTRNGHVVFKKDFGTGHFPIKHTEDKWNEVEYTGVFYFIPTVLPNLSICYLVTNSSDAVKLLFNKLDTYVKDGKESFIGIDFNLHPVDDWNCFVTFFGLDKANNKKLVGSRVVPK